MTLEDSGDGLKNDGAREGTVLRKEWVLAGYCVLRKIDGAIAAIPVPDGAFMLFGGMACHDSAGDTV